VAITGGAGSRERGSSFIATGTTVQRVAVGRSSLTLCEREAEQPALVIVQPGRLGVLLTLLGSLLGGKHPLVHASGSGGPLFFLT